MAIHNIEKKGPSSPPALPWLMLSEKRKGPKQRRFFSLAYYKVYKLGLPEASGENV